MKRPNPQGLEIYEAKSAEPYSLSGVVKKRLEEKTRYENMMEVQG